MEGLGGRVVSQNRIEMLDKIQRKREIMIESASKNGFTSGVTIRHSQELDQLIYDYQCRFQKANGKEKEVKRVFNPIMMMLPKIAVNF